jgi:hypothetical protein
LTNVRTDKLTANDNLELPLFARKVVDLLVVLLLLHLLFDGRSGRDALDPHH